MVSWRNCCLPRWAREIIKKPFWCTHQGILEGKLRELGWPRKMLSSRGRHWWSSYARSSIHSCSPKSRRTLTAYAQYGLSPSLSFSPSLSKFPHSKCISKHSTVMQCYQHCVSVTNKSLWLTITFFSPTSHHQWRQVGAQWGVCYTRVGILLLTLTQHYDVNVGRGKLKSLGGLSLPHSSSSQKV